MAILPSSPSRQRVYALRGESNPNPEHKTLQSVMLAWRCLLICHSATGRALAHGTHPHDLQYGQIAAMRHIRLDCARFQ
jgi:hypothetical protein